MGLDIIAYKVVPIILKIIARIVRRSNILYIKVYLVAISNNNITFMPPNRFKFWYLAIA